MYVASGMGRCGMGDVFLTQPVTPACTCVGGTCMEDGNSCSSPVVDSGNVCDTTSKMFDAKLCNNLYVPATSTAAASTSTLTSFLNANSTYVVIGAVALLALLVTRR
jgi:hypothetical protein